ncbi:zinc dependent phospholipase C family protein [Hydrogenophaga sp.]|uniref:zinc dependent phospholipase C family protein n=1 Tax=Hydrogenophaga sp. TaxID=1904254 RepID=UPI00391A19C0
MPGAYAHITLLHLSIARARESDALPADRIQALDRWTAHAEFGALSPDFPYLAGHTAWADLMHHSGNNTLLHCGLNALQGLAGEPRERAFAWLMGYAAHMVADMTIHPVINRLVGPYEANKTAHRTCEMHMDVHAFARLGLGDAGLTRHLEKHLASVETDPARHLIDPAIGTMWAQMLSQTHPDTARDDPPAPHAWYRSFVGVMNTIRGVNRKLPFARHLGAGFHLDYPNPNELDPRYLKHLPTPHGPMSYDMLLALAVANIHSFWLDLTAAIDPPHHLNMEAWNLDTGQSAEQPERLVFWPGA